MLITIQEYADKIGLTRSSVYSAIKKGKIKVYKIKDKKIQYMIDENEDYTSRINHYEKKYKGISYHPLYSVWRDMKDRCFNPKSKAYKYYGERGITVCDEWKNNALAFIQWGMMNNYEKGLQIDRINNNGNYEPNNCRFVTSKVNNNNRRDNISEIEKIQR